ncbi:MAG: helix-turn-helix transcriptional regulator [Ruminococcus sp.]|nr:helix-turn-helix transcriptional regulator [Ruminococcus sp.]
MERYIHEVVPDTICLPVHYNYFSENTMFVPSHWHEHLEVIFLLEGELSISAGGKTALLRSGEIYLINCREIHETHSSGCASGYLLQIPLEFLKRYLPDIEDIHFRELYMQGDASFPELSKLFQEMSERFERKERGYQFLFSSLLLRFLYVLYLDAEKTENTAKNKRDQRNFKRIDQVMCYVRAHYDQPVSLSDAAGMVALQPEYFCRLFRSYTGQTFLEYVSAVRLSAFYELLLQTDEDITVLTERCGFSGYKTFRKRFYQVYGCTPSECRRKYQNEKRA